MNGKILSVVLMITVAGAILVNALVSNPLGPSLNVSASNVSSWAGEQPIKFNSPEEIEAFLKKNTERTVYRGYFGGSLDLAAAPMALEKSTYAGEFSTTNIQVEGVDEADIVKNDGRYIYVLSGNRVSIIDAYPPEDAEILSSIRIKGQPQELFINKDRLIVLGNDFNKVYPLDEGKRRAPNFAPDEVEPYPGRMTSQEAVAYVYDITDRSDPLLVKEVSVDGGYFDSRMIGDHVYVLANQYALYYDGVISLPEVRSSSWGTTNTESLDVYYFDVPDYSYSYTNIISFDAQADYQEVEGKTYLLGSAQNIFVSQNNIYITYERRFPEPYFYERVVDAVIEPLVSGSVSSRLKEVTDSNKSRWEKVLFEKRIQRRLTSLEREIAKEMERTVVHKIGIKDGDIEFVATGEVPGRVLNQFSMDEYGGHFRIATTTGHVSGRGAQTSANHIYVLDQGLEIVGAVEDLAPGERIYSARFMGKRAYLVTFQKVDPLFVIDLADPEAPRVLGKLKIPGYSDYLHPYDENHLIGLGKEAVEAEEGNFAWYQGVKLALFDVSDVERPKEISKVVIGDRGTDSYALQDHKAFLFSREKNLLVIPILLAEIDYEKYPRELPRNAYGDYVWQGAYVFRIDAEEGLKLKGRISHGEDDGRFLKSGRYYYGSGDAVKRSLYMDNTLYTVSDAMVKMNDLVDLDELNKVYLPG